MEAGEKRAEWMTMEEITSVSLPIKKILLATDGSVASVKATKYCVALARKLNAEILGVYVQGPDNIKIQKELQGNKFFGGVNPTEAGLAVAKAFGIKNSVKVNTTILSGNVAKNIVKAALADKVDLIIIGETGRSGVSKMSLGAVAKAVTKLAPCPVLVIKEGPQSDKHEQME